MELDELKSTWQRLDRRVDELTRMHRSMLTHTLTRKARWRLVPVLIGSVLNIIAGAIFAVACGAFWSAHLDKPAVVVAGITLHLASIGLILIGAVRVALVLRVNYTQPVLEIQKSLAALQAWEARSFHAVWLASWVIIPAALTAAVMGLAGIDLWQVAPAWIVANFAVCLVGGLAPLLLHRWAHRRGGKLAAWFDAFLMNRSVARAREALDELDEFARP